MVGTIIAKLRKSKGLNRYRLAKNSRVSQSHLTRIEDGRVKHPTFAVMIAIADALDVSLDELAERGA